MHSKLGVVFFPLVSEVWVSSVVIGEQRGWEDGGVEVDVVSADSVKEINN